MKYSLPVSARSTRRRGEYSAGLSLIELLAVVLVLAVASAVVAPQLGKHDDLKIRSASQALTCELNEVQALAIARRQPLYVRLDRSGTQFAVLDAINPDHAMMTPQGRDAWRLTLGDGATAGVAATANFDGRATFAFDYDGAPRSVDDAGQLCSLEHGWITLTCGRDARTLWMQPLTGILNVERPAL